jgi:hypothetical protein
VTTHLSRQPTLRLSSSVMLQDNMKTGYHKKIDRSLLIWGFTIPLGFVDDFLQGEKVPYNVLLKTYVNSFWSMVKRESSWRHIKNMLSNRIKRMALRKASFRCLNPTNRI